MTKRFTALLLVIAALLCIVAGCSNTSDALVGVWKLNDGEPDTYGVALAFYKDGTIAYGLTDGGDATLANYTSELNIIDKFMNTKYEVTKDGITLTSGQAVGTVSGGDSGSSSGDATAAATTTTVPFVLDGDSLTFDGIHFTRMK